MPNSGLLTQHVLETLYQDLTPYSGLLSQNVLEFLYTEQALGIASGGLTQSVIEVLTSRTFNPTGYVTQSVIEAIIDPVYPLLTGFVSQSVIEVISSPPVRKTFNIPIENLLNVCATDSDILLVGVLANDGGSWTNETSQAKNATADDMTLLPSSPAVNDAYYFGGGNLFEKVHLNISTVGDWNGSLTWEYYNGTSWVTVPNLIDSTDAFRNNGQNEVSWTLPADWCPKLVNLVFGYFIRARVSIFTSIAAQPFGRSAFITTRSTPGRIPIEIINTKFKKFIPIRCTGCLPPCCPEPCCCGCEDSGVINLEFWSDDCTTQDGSNPESDPPRSTSPIRSGIYIAGKTMVPTNPAEHCDPFDDCLSSQGLIGLTANVWSGEICVCSDAFDYWMLTFGCGISGGGNDGPGCNNFQLKIQVLVCSGEMSDPPMAMHEMEPNCDDQAGVTFMSSVGGSDLGSQAIVPSQVGELVECSCDPWSVRYTGVCFEDYMCCCCRTDLNTNCWAFNLLGNPGPGRSL
jgi:hypothetical protein